MIEEEKWMVVDDSSFIMMMKDNSDEGWTNIILIIWLFHLLYAALTSMDDDDDDDDSDRSMSASFLTMRNRRTSFSLSLFSLSPSWWNPRPLLFFLDHCGHRWQCHARLMSKSCFFLAIQSVHSCVMFPWLFCEVASFCFLLFFSVWSVFLSFPAFLFLSLPFLLLSFFPLYLLSASVSVRLSSCYSPSPSSAPNKADKNWNERPLETNEHRSMNHDKWWLFHQRGGQEQRHETRHDQAKAVKDEWMKNQDPGMKNKDMTKKEQDEKKQKRSRIVRGGEEK